MALCQDKQAAKDAKKAAKQAGPKQRGRPKGKAKPKAARKAKAKSRRNQKRKRDDDSDDDNTKDDEHEDREKEDSEKEDVEKEDSEKENGEREDVEKENSEKENSDSEKENVNCENADVEINLESQGPGGNELADGRGGDSHPPGVVDMEGNSNFGAQEDSTFTEGQAGQSSVAVPPAPEPVDTNVAEQNPDVNNDCAIVEASVETPPTMEPILGPDADEHGASSSSTRRRVSEVPRAPHVHRTPSEIFRLLQPCPVFELKMKYNDHRFEVQTKKVDARFVKPYSGKTFSKSFANSCWKTAIRQVHQHMWQKWQLIKDDNPCAVPEQVPGEVPQDIMDSLERLVKDMPSPVKYPRLL